MARIIFFWGDDMNECENPSEFNGENNPVENVSWYDAIYFCNKLSDKLGLNPVYSVMGSTDVKRWNYIPHQGNRLWGIAQNFWENGFRLPTLDEWIYAGKGGQNYRYAGSDNLNEVGWYRENSMGKTHPVAQKKANGYGLYDMSGNVWEWVWDSHRDYRYICGGSMSTDGGWGSYECYVERRSRGYEFDGEFKSAEKHGSALGFRIVRNTQ